MTILYTSALIPHKCETRIIDYKKSYDSLCSFFDENKINVLECYSSDWSIIDKNKNSIFISHTHQKNLRNKGVLEFMCIKKFLDSVEIKDEYLLKITGRYQLLSDEFIKITSHNQGYDFYGKLVDNNTQIFTGFFIIKTSVMIDFVNKIDFDFLETNMINIEKYLKDFLTTNNKKCQFYDELKLFAPIFGVGEIQNIYL